MVEDVVSSCWLRIIFDKIKYILFSRKDVNNSNQQNNTTIINVNDVVSNGEANSIQSESSEGTCDSSRIELATEYVSIFAENEKIMNEDVVINIKNDNNNIIGTIKLRNRDNTEYELSGKFNNKVLTAEYWSKKKSNDERGVISLKLINDKILSGFCSFTKSSTQDMVRVSPYVWIAKNTNEELLAGTFGFCLDCKKANKGYCCNSDAVDLPILLPNDCLRIKNRYRDYVRAKTYSTPLDGNKIIRVMKPNANNKDGGCFFFTENPAICKIYNERPIDCRLFPFDIILDKQSNEYWIGYYKSICPVALPDRETMLEYAHILRPYFYLEYPHLHILTSDLASKKLNKSLDEDDFEKLGRVRNFLL